MGVGLYICRDFAQRAVVSWTRQEGRPQFVIDFSFNIADLWKVLQMIMDLVGSPSEEDLAAFDNNTEPAKKFLRRVHKVPQPLHAVVPTKDADGMDH